MATAPPQFWFQEGGGEWLYDPTGRGDQDKAYWVGTAADRSKFDPKNLDGAELWRERQDRVYKANGWGKYAGQGGAGGGAPGSLNMGDWASTSQSFAGLPGWASGIVQGYQSQYGPWAMQNFQNAVQGLNKAPALIDQLRRSQNKWAVRESLQPVQDAVNSSIRQAVGSGIMGSSMSGDLMGRVGEQFSMAAGRQANQSGQWAANANIQNLQQKLAAGQGFAGMLGDLLGLSKYSQSSSYNPMSPGQLGMSWLPNEGALPY